jgi:hypothetical protein
MKDVAFILHPSSFILLSSSPFPPAKVCGIFCSKEVCGMAIEFRCNQCGRLLRTGDDTAGLMAQCPECGSQTPIPVPAAETVVTPVDIEPLEPTTPGSPISGSAGSTPFGAGPAESDAGENPYHSPSQYGPTLFEQDPCRKQATIALVLGSVGIILSMFCCFCFPVGFVVSAAGLVFGIIGLRSQTNRNFAVIGIVLSGAGMALAIVAGGFFLLSSVFENHQHPLR